jgi:DNA replication protein DnaC
MWSPAEVERRIEELSGKIEDAVFDLKDLAEESGRLKSNHNVAIARKLLEAKVSHTHLTSVDDRKAWALVECAELNLEHEIMERRYQAQRDVLQAARTEADMLRTLLVQARGVQDPRR